MRVPEALFIVGVVLIAFAVGALAGVWWGVLVGGVELVALAVLTRAAAPAPRPRGSVPGVGERWRQEPST